jgi:phosphoserine phosphatase RsbU/P
VASLRLFWRSLGRAEYVFLALLAAYALLAFTTRPVWLPLLSLGLYAAGAWVTVRWLRLGLRRTIWRLRNRLIVAYLFIALVPISLLLVLAGISLYVLTGQVAAYIVGSELERRTAALRSVAERLAEEPRPMRAMAIERAAGFLRGRFPKVEILIEDDEVVRYPADSAISGPGEGWGDAQGVALKGPALVAWAHVRRGSARVTATAVIDQVYLKELASGLGEAYAVPFGDAAGEGNNPDFKIYRSERTLPKHNLLDFEVAGASPMALSNWSAPEKRGTWLLLVYTRPSALLGALFAGQVDFGRGVLAVFVGVAALFFIVEMVSFVIGISLTRTITGAVHALYTGTQKINEGDFSHRIPVHGRDQLAELGVSFNRMTENLERLIAVEKEKERLQSEIEIAREVQKQLFPKRAPHLATLRIAGVCRPARAVSGDYYDYVTLPGGALAIAIGDVAGKGISAALLMAAIQSILRTQLTAPVPAMALASSSGNGAGSVSTADLVSQINRQLYATTSPEKYATFFCGVYEESSGRLTYTNGGHPPPVLIRNGAAELLEATGPAVGLFPGSRYEDAAVGLAQGDLLVAYTDGISEPENAYGEMFGDRRLLEVLLECRELEPDAIVDRVLDAVKQWTGPGEAEDDMTLVVARRV